MKKILTWITALLFAGILVSSPALATIYTAHSPEDTSIDAGFDILNVSVDDSGADYLFSMVLRGAPSTAGSTYGIYLGLPGNTDFPTVVDSGVENYLNWSRRLGFRFDDNGTFFNGTSIQDVAFMKNDSTLQWVVGKDLIGSDWFLFSGATFNQSQLIDSTSVAATPIPGAAWLLASGLIGLVGLRRKSS